MPIYAHIPLIHGADGAKLSKRHGSLGIDSYRDMGFLPEALRNYLIRLGWSHGDDEIISDTNAIEWFNIKDVGRAPSRFNIDKLKNLNGHYIRESSDEILVKNIAPRLEKTLCRSLNTNAITRLTKGMAGLKTRSKTVSELSQSAIFYVHTLPLPMDDKARDVLINDNGKVIRATIDLLKDETDWRAPILESCLRTLAEQKGLKLGKVAQPLRAALCGSTVSPSIFEVMEVLGKKESIARFSGVLPE
tara:strand:- start:9 stop:749 length:741 start_codon:yes stop_codon:yes gene_type:complete